MKLARLISQLGMGLTTFCFITAAQAIPLWSFTPDVNFPPNTTVTSTGTALVKYSVTNQSRTSHTLEMTPITGISQVTTGPGTCGNPFILGYQQSCILTLQVNGSSLTGDVLGGPVVCQQGNRLQCYQPSQANSLAVRLISPPTQQYTITPFAGANGSINPSTAQVVNPGSTITFTATPNPSYGVNQWLVDGNPVQTGGASYQLSNITANHTVNVTFGTVTLTPTVSSLALSVACSSANASCAVVNTNLTGNQRIITVQNTGSANATHVSVNSSGLPSGTSISATTCNGTLNAGSQCTITLSPGAIATSSSNNTPCTSGTQPIAGSVVITADGGLSSQVNAYVLGYGCIYQGGFVYAVDDTTTNTGSIGGKAVTMSDQVAPNLGIIWSANNSGGYDNGISIWGIDQTSTPASPSPNASSPQPATLYPLQSNCQGKSDGACDTNNIYVYYQNNGAGHPIPLSYYAAGLCKTTINSYSDWYLPSICEMSYVFGGPGCNIGTQNITNNFSALIGTTSSGNPSTSCPLGANCLAGIYWSSTEYLSNNEAWVQNFDFVSGNTQFIEFKSAPLGVRCSRDLTL